MTESTESKKNAVEQLIARGAEFYSRGWLFGTSGNLSTVLQNDPLRIVITASGFDKGNLDESMILEIDGELNVISGSHKPSSESALHVAIVKNRGAGAVFHTHSTWGTILSETHSVKGGINLSGFEMLKGLDGVGTHDHSEWIPVLENSQDMSNLSVKVTGLLNDSPGIHGFLLRGHGLYTWGKTAEDAKRHVEVLEFLMEVYARTRSGTA